MVSDQLVVSFNKVTDVMHDYIFSGGILKGGTWGGKECKGTISLEAHSTEMVLWFLVSIIIYRLCQYKKYHPEMLKEAAAILKNHERTKTSQILDVLFSCLHFGIWLLVLYYKITLHSLVNMCQPCHIALFVQGVGAIVGGPHGAVIGIISLPLVVGPIGALLVPALDGLDQPYEELFFFIQHYLLLVTPLFLLLRNNYCAFKVLNFRSLVYANWTLLILHWFIFAPMNRHFEVNVNFMLCPSEGMRGPFEMLPPWLIWPSYRTVIVTSFFILSFPICYAYIGVSYLIMVVIEKVKEICFIGIKNNDPKAEVLVSCSKLDDRYSLNTGKQKCF